MFWVFFFTFDRFSRFCRNGLEGRDWPLSLAKSFRQRCWLTYSSLKVRKASFFRCTLTVAWSKMPFSTIAACSTRLCLKVSFWNTVPAKNRTAAGSYIALDRKSYVCECNSARGFKLTSTVSCCLLSHSWKATAAQYDEAVAAWNGMQCIVEADGKMRSIIRCLPVLCEWCMLR